MRARVEDFKERFIDTGVFVSSGKNVRWTIDSKPSVEVVQRVIDVFNDLAVQLKEYQLKE